MKIEKTDIHKRARQKRVFTKFEEKLIFECITSKSIVLLEDISKSKSMSQTTTEDEGFLQIIDVRGSATDVYEDIDESCPSPKPIKITEEDIKDKGYDDFMQLLDAIEVSNDNSSETAKRRYSLGNDRNVPLPSSSANNRPKSVDSAASLHRHVDITKIMSNLRNGRPPVKINTSDSRFRNAQTPKERFKSIQKNLAVDELLNELKNSQVNSEQNCEKKMYTKEDRLVDKFDRRMSDEILGHKVKQYAEAVAALDVKPADVTLKRKVLETSQYGNSNGMQPIKFAKSENSFNHSEQKIDEFTHHKPDETPNDAIVRRITSNNVGVIRKMNIADKSSNNTVRLTYEHKSDYEDQERWTDQNISERLIVNSSYCINSGATPEEKPANTIEDMIQFQNMQQRFNSLKAERKIRLQFLQYPIKSAQQPLPSKNNFIDQNKSIPSENTSSIYETITPPPINAPSIIAQHKIPVINHPPYISRYNLPLVGKTIESVPHIGLANQAQTQYRTNPNIKYHAPALAQLSSNIRHADDRHSKLLLNEQLYQFRKELTWLEEQASKRDEEKNELLQMCQQKVKEIKELERDMYMNKLNQHPIRRDLVFAQYPATYNQKQSQNSVESQLINNQCNLSCSKYQILYSRNLCCDKLYPNECASNQCNDSQCVPQSRPPLVLQKPSTSPKYITDVQSFDAPKIPQFSNDHLINQKKIYTVSSESQQNILPGPYDSLFTKNTLIAKSPVNVQIRSSPTVMARNKMSPNPTKVIQNLICHNCPRKAEYICSNCNSTSYCSTVCQANDWQNHSVRCVQQST